MNISDNSFDGSCERETISVVDIETATSVRPIHLPEANVPIVILFGPTKCGKTMTLVRLCQYLLANGYCITPYYGFHCDTYYEDRCQNFLTAIHSINYIDTNQDDILVAVYDKKKHLICCVYDAAGKNYFDPQLTNKDIFYSSNIAQLFVSENPKIWCFFTEPNYEDAQTRIKYTKTIKNVRNMMSFRDKTIIIHNKIDKTPFMRSLHVVDVKAIKKSVDILYPSIFEIFKNTNVFLKWIKPYNFVFVPFMTGFYPKTVDNIGNSIRTYSRGPDVYPEMLWKEINRYVG